MAAPAARSSEHAFPSVDDLRPETDCLTGIDLSLIRENLKLTPWERILANDNTVNFCDMGRAALSQARVLAERGPSACCEPNGV
ncbi:hypothetical protein [Prosthecobacter sp.]|uniref:hypothetical protein n=1 Tax=Prosthecobacter sp. TaxID=1965333 RepID=UPI003783FFB8